MFFICDNCHGIFNDKCGYDIHVYSKKCTDIIIIINIKNSFLHNILQRTKDYQDDIIKIDKKIKQLLNKIKKTNKKISMYNKMSSNYIFKININTRVNLYKKTISQGDIQLISEFADIVLSPINYEVCRQTFTNITVTDKLNSN
jgi:hypothetical protein